MSHLFPILAVSVLLGISSLRADAATNAYRADMPAPRLLPGQSNFAFTLYGAQATRVTLQRSSRSYSPSSTSPRVKLTPRFTWTQVTESEIGSPLPQGEIVELEIPRGESRFVEFTPGPQTCGNGWVAMALRFGFRFFNPPGIDSGRMRLNFQVRPARPFP